MGILPTYNPSPPCNSINLADTYIQHDSGSATALNRSSDLLCLRGRPPRPYPAAHQDPRRRRPLPPLLGPHHLRLPPALPARLGRRPLPPLLGPHHLRLPP